jgi:5'-methylthioadenosine phosphorylase
MTIINLKPNRKAIKMTDNLVGIIGGTGLGDILAEHITTQTTVQPDTPFGKPSSPVMLGSIGKNKIAFLNRHGPGHIYNPSNVPYTANIFALKKIGVTSIIASAAVGSLQDHIHPKDLIIPDQFIDKTFRRQNSFFDDLGAVHCEFSHPCCERLRTAIINAAENIKTATHKKATYVCMEGPQFSTRAESLMHKSWGADLIGMTALPEAKLAREAQMCYALIALASDYDCWKELDITKGKLALLEEIIDNLTAATMNAVELIKTVLNAGEKLCDDACPCRNSLELAVWTKQQNINTKKRREFDVLFK